MGCERGRVRPHNASVPPTPRSTKAATYRLTLEYEGTRYHGWQEQQNARSVAGELRRAMQEALGEGNPIKELGGSGRTDAGVHALAQTAHLRLAPPAEPDGLRREGNDPMPAHLPPPYAAPAPAPLPPRHAPLPPPP